MHHRRHLIVLTLIALACAGLPARAGTSTLTLNVLYSFTNGVSPNAGLTLGTDGNIYGTTETGGANNLGGIFEVSSNGLTNVFSLDGANGAAPLAPLIQDNDGNFYGTASSGGGADNGTVFKIANGFQMQWVVSFNDNDGSTPLAPLLEGTDKSFYGTTFSGGSNNLGTIFRVNSAGLLTSVHSFAGGDGANPVAGLIQGSDGNLYGTTEYGGKAGFGTVFKLTYAGALTSLCSFSNDTGAYPGGLIEDSNRNFYGCTLSGGANVAGTIFQLSQFATLQTLFTFDLADGANPNSPLTVASRGNWYGTTKSGGAYNEGIIFQLNLTGGLTVLASFAGANGASPLSGVIQGTDGNFYGTTSQGGANGYGEIYELSGFPPYIIAPPESQRWVSNHVATFSVVAGGSAALSYQWLFDSNNIANATSSSYTVTNQELTTSGTYTVIVSNLFGVTNADAVLGVPAPTVTIVSPLAGARQSNIVLKGTAAAFARVTNVNYWITNVNATNILTNSGAASLSASATTTNWSITNALLPGTNYVAVQSVDSLGNPSRFATREFFYIVPALFTLKTNEPSTITGAASVAGNVRPTNGAMLNIGEEYSLTERPANSNYLFSNWVSSAGFINGASTLHFIMESNLTITANFIPNFFNGAVGAYNGLFSGADVTEQTAGMLKNLRIGSTGAYSGILMLGGVPYSLIGNFDLSGFAGDEVNRTTANGGPVHIIMKLNWTNREIYGIVSGSNSVAWDSVLEAEKSAASSPSAEYTVLLGPGTNAIGEIPPGFGYMLITNQNGSMRLSGALADGTAFSQTVPLGVSNDVPVYANLYANAGLLLGWLGLSNGTVVAETNLAWIKPAARSGIYTNGFTNLLSVSGAGWIKPRAGYLTNGTLTISNTSVPLVFTVSITNSTLLKEPGSPTNSLTGLFYPKTGLLQFTFGNGTGRDTTTGRAAILGNSTNGGGYFLTKTNAGAITLTP